MSVKYCASRKGIQSTRALDVTAVARWAQGSLPVDRPRYACHNSRISEMTSTAVTHAVRAFKALGHPARLRIVAMLRAGELCACQVTAVLHLAPSTVSAHLAELRRAGLVVERKEGRWVHYRLAQTKDAIEIGEWLWERIKRDPRIRGDAAVVRQLRKVPVAELCAADLDLDRLAISRTA
jgi:ArsR family transcriptional regulator